MRTEFKKRLFIGIPAGREIKPILTDIQSLIQYNPVHIRWVPPRNIHMTLFFLGNIFLDEIPHLAQTIKNVINVNHFKVSIETTGVFPSIRAPRIFWLGVGNTQQKLTKLYKQIEKAMISFKGSKKKEGFIPHITIGRTTRSYGKIDVLPFLKYVYSPIQLDVNSVALYESQLLSQWTEYKVLTEFQLN